MTWQFYDIVRVITRLHSSTVHRLSRSTSRKKGLTTSHMHTQINPFALKLTSSPLQDEACTKADG